MKKILLLVICIIVATTMFACVPIGAESFPNSESTEGSFEGEVSYDEGSIEDTVSDDVSDDVSATNDGWDQVDDLIPIIEDLGKDICNIFSNGSSSFYWNESVKTLEAWMQSESGDICVLLRMKKSSELEDIVSDLVVEWTSEEEISDDSLSGIRREGTLSVTKRMRDINKLLFDNDEIDLCCDIWYDKTDKMTYSIVTFDDTTVYDPYPIFHPELFTEVDFETFDEAKSFIETHNYNGTKTNKIFMRGNRDDFVYITCQSDDVVTVYYGKESDYIEKIYQQGMDIYSTHYTVEATEDGRTEIREAEDQYYESKYDNNNKLTETIQRNYNEGTEYIYRYENDILVYSRVEDDQGVTEEQYTENGKTKKYYNKFEAAEYTSIYKLLVENGENKYYVLSTEGDFGYRKYTYVSEDSPNLIGFESYNVENDDHVVWILDGTPCSDMMENVISLERTYKGKTTFYTADEVPWGTGMAYPPHFQHELNF